MPKIFVKVKCKAYLKKESDGIFLNCTKRTHYEFNGKDCYNEEPAKGNAWNMDEDIRVVAMQNVYENGRWETRELKDLSEFEGGSVVKTYRHRVEENFTAFVVGYTQIITSADIGTSYSEMHVDCYDREWIHLTKDSHYTKVAVVYFKNNMRRYVLPEDIEEVKQ